MFVGILGVFDVLAALLLFAGGSGVPGAGWLVTLIALTLLAKALISFFPMPIFLPVTVMGVVDVIAAIMLIFGAGAIPTPDAFEHTLAAILIIKGLLSIFARTIEIVG